MSKRSATLNEFQKENYYWKTGIDYRKQPELYRVGKGEQGVQICEPYKSEIGRHWKFKNEFLALKSSKTIYALFLGYLQEDDFVGADMARKYLQMGFTRARRYVNFKGGKKYESKCSSKMLIKGTGEAEKAKSALVFYRKWRLAEKNSKYAMGRREWSKFYG